MALPHGLNLQLLGKRVLRKPCWYNDETSGLVNSAGCQQGASRGLLALNHVLRSLRASQTPVNLALFQTLSSSRDTENFDLLDLLDVTAAFGIASEPLPQRRAGAAYLLHSPGHFVALTPTRLGYLLCDSLLPLPFILTAAELEAVLTLYCHMQLQTAHPHTCLTPGGLAAGQACVCGDDRLLRVAMANFTRFPGFGIQGPLRLFRWKMCKMIGGRGPHSICAKDALIRWGRGGSTQFPHKIVQRRWGRGAPRNSPTKLREQGGGGALCKFHTKNKCRRGALQYPHKNVATLLVTSAEQKIFSKLCFQRGAARFGPRFFSSCCKLGARDLCAAFSHGVILTLEADIVFFNFFLAPLLGDVEQAKIFFLQKVHGFGGLNLRTFLS